MLFTDILANKVTYRHTYKQLKDMLKNNVTYKNT